MYKLFGELDTKYTSSYLKRFVEMGIHSDLYLCCCSLENSQDINGKVVSRERQDKIRKVLPNKTRFLPANNVVQIGVKPGSMSGI